MVKSAEKVKFSSHVSMFGKGTAAGLETLAGIIIAVGVVISVVVVVGVVAAVIVVMHNAKRLGYSYQKAMRQKGNAKKSYPSF